MTDYKRLQQTTADYRIEFEIDSKGMMQVLIRQSLDASESKDPFSVGSRALFIGVGGSDRAQISGDFFWHVSGPAHQPQEVSPRSVIDTNPFRIDQDDVQMS